MSKLNVTINSECNSCSKLSQKKCGGKKSPTPCIAYISNNQYAKNSIKAIKHMIKR